MVFLCCATPAKKNNNDFSVLGEKKRIGLRSHLYSFKKSSMSPSRIIAIPFVISAALFFYLAWEVDNKYTIYLFPVLLVLALIFVMSPQINWYFYQKNPPDLSRPLRKFFETRHPYYQQLPDVLKLRFRQRTALIMAATDFIPQGLEKLTEDVKALASSNAALLTLNRTDYLFREFEHLVVYTHPFSTPAHPDQLHASELYEEGANSTLIFSIQHLIKGTLQPAQYFNVGLYEYARAYRICFPDVTFPQMEDDQWPLLEKVGGVEKSALVSYINLEPLDVQAVAVAWFFTFPQRFKAILPEAYETLKQIFG